MAEYIFKEAERSSYLTVNTNEIITTFEKKERIVRCRDCKHYEYMGITQGWINVCTRGGHMMLVTSDGFCAWGEPKEGE